MKENLKLLINQKNSFNPNLLCKQLSVTPQRMKENGRRECKGKIMDNHCHSRTGKRLECHQVKSIIAVFSVIIHPVIPVFGNDLYSRKIE